MSDQQDAKNLNEAATDQDAVVAANTQAEQETVAEPVVTPVAEPIVEPTLAEPTVVEPAVQPTAAEPAVEPVTAAPANPQPSYEAPAQPVVEPLQQPNYQALAQPHYTDNQQAAYAAGAAQQQTPPAYSQPAQQPVAQKSKIAAGLLGILLGTFGVHNFYLGYTGKAIAQLLITVLSLGFLAFVSGIWGLIEGILILVAQPGTPNSFDARGVPLSQ